MKRIKVAGLCLVAVFAFTALAVSSAQAGQFGQCVKVKKNPTTKKYEGKYEAGCSNRNPKNEGKYEWEPNVGKVAFTDEGGEAVLESAAGATKCKHSTSVGEIIGASENKDTFTFVECTAEPKAGLVVPCQNKGGAKGVIKTELLTSHLLDFPEKSLNWNQELNGGLGGFEEVGPKEGEVWMSYTGTPQLAEYECGPGLFTVHVTGEVAGIIPEKYIEKALKKGKAGKVKEKNGVKTYTPGKPTFTAVFAKKTGEQALFATLEGPAVEGALDEHCPEEIEAGKYKTLEECEAAHAGAKVTVPAVQNGVVEVALPVIPSKDFEIAPI